MLLKANTKHRSRTLALALLVAASIIPVACNSQGRVLARVGDATVTEEDLNRELIIQQGAKMLLQMIDMALIEQAAAKEGVSISEGELDVKYQQAAARIGSERDLEEKLKETRRGKQEFRAELRAEGLLDRLAMRQSPASDADLRKYYEQRKVEFSHKEQARVRLMLFRERANADTVVEALKDPQANFAGLAKAFSEDPATKDEGGDTGWFERGDYAKAIGDMAFKLAPGQVSGVFEVPDGFAILKVEGKRPGGVEPFEKVKESVRSRVQLEQLEWARRDWLQAARERAQVEIGDELLKARVRQLIEAKTPFEPSNLAPGIPMAPR
ncbi:MAG: peptidyl-prolyl cis-trans isomerase [Armatimonadia bacterium]